MDYNFLGASGVRVSNLCLGTLTFGPNSYAPLPTQTDEDLALQIMDRYAQLGGNFLDTANVYGHGASEKIVGKWLSGKERKRFILATKVRSQMDKTHENGVGLSRRHIVEGCEESLERLQTHYIDLYQSHGWDNATPIEETLRTFNDLIRCGKIRYFGASNVCGWQMQKIVDKISVMGLNKCVSLQQQYSLLCRQSEFEEFMVCENEGVGILPWSPLKGGLLSGKFSKEEVPDPTGSRVGFIHTDERRALQAWPGWSKYRDDVGFWNLTDVMKKAADNHGKTVAQVALRWLLQKPQVCSVIFGATSVRQLEDNMGASVGWSLTQEEMHQLDKSSPRVNMYPYETIWRLNGNRYNTFDRSNQLS